MSPNFGNMKVVLHFRKLSIHNCRNFNLRLTTKARAYKGGGQKKNLGIKFHAHGSVWKCEWKNEPPHSQMKSHFGSWSPDGLPNFKKEIIKVKIHWIEKFFISLERSWNVDV